MIHALIIYAAGFVTPFLLLAAWLIFIDDRRSAK